MLVLSRKPGEALRIGEDIEVTIVEVKGEMVRLGIDAPRSVPVWRKELWVAIVEENRKAAEEAASAEIPVVKPAPVPVKVTDLLVKKKNKGIAE
ncbi:MAG: carbon storage regulator CsrA [Synergistaceae bacterium]|jgi:carbon storage regulator|nr:carbon storage regulator CsrA [Synergistaceae bacterium]